MSERQPRDDKGRFTEIDTENPKEVNNSQTIAVLDDEQVTPRVEYTNVDVELLETAIDRSKKHDGIVRIGTLSKQVTEDGKSVEKGLVLLKGTPADDEVVSVAGLFREWDDE